MKNIISSFYRKNAVLLLFIFIISFLPCCTTSKNTVNYSIHKTVYTDSAQEEVQQKAHFKGGEAALYDYISKNLKYPKSERRKGIEGVVYVSFIVDRNGNIYEAEIVKGLSKKINKDALKTIANMPPWNPSIVDGRRKATQITLPLKYELEGSFSDKYFKN